MKCSPEAGERINSFALVSYIPDPLGTFLDRIRQELVRSCVARSHVTILPPRELSSSQEDVERELIENIQDLPPFTVELTRVELFQETQVIYLGIGAGGTELKRMHDLMNHAALGSNESHGYHPHVTLAQEFPSPELNDLLRMAEDRWSSFQHARFFEVESLTFVQNTITNRWLDLARFPLRDSVPSVTR